MTLSFGAGWAVIEDIGQRPHMEDRYIAAEKISAEMLLFGVFDGHNGAEVAVYCKTNLGGHIKREMADHTRLHSQHSKPVEHALTAAIEELDRMGSIDPTLPKAKDVGSTACMVVVTLNHIWFVNVGDSRALLRMDSGVRQMSVDHKPNLKSESDRVRRHGGFISNTDGSWRINGRLNLSRSIGDWSMRPFIVPHPTLKHHQRQGSSNEYVILASDGLFDVMSNVDVTDIVDQSPHTREGLTRALKALVSESRKRGSTDNITIMYVGLSIDKSSQAITRGGSRVSVP